MDDMEDAVARDVLATFVEESAELLRELEASLHRAASAGASVGAAGTWREALRLLHTLKGAASVAGASSMKEEAHKLEERIRVLYESDAPFDPALGDELFTSLEVLRVLASNLTPEDDEGAPRSADAGAIRQAHGYARAPAVSAGQPPTAPLDAGAALRSFSADLLRIKPQRVDSLHALASELTVSRLQFEALTASILRARDLCVEAEDAARHHLTIVRALRQRLPAAAWQSLVASSQALIGHAAAAARETGATARDAPMIQAQATAAIAGVEDGIRELRLMPLEPFFEGYIKVARDAARACDKPVQVRVRAEGAEIDRAVLMRLRDPFLHLVRNAVVHGIEPPEVRRAAGKNPAGTILLEARSSGSRAALRVADDGAGVDIDAVCRKALSMGLLDRRRALSDEELLDILTYPGFSTRDAVDTLAGRGIGLDVVADTVHDLDGKLLLDNLPGAGSIFTIDVPITASTGAGLVVRAGDQLFGLLLHHIDRVVRLADDQITLIEGRETTLLDRDPLAVVTLASLLGQKGSRRGSERRPAIVLRLGRQRLVVLVDDIPGEQSMVIKPLSEAFAAARLILGGALQPDGSVIPVLQASALFELAGTSRPSLSQAERPAPWRQKEPISVLVVDDSITMRTLIRNILQAAGYAVTVAHDGVAAVEELLCGRPCGLVITDLQMPRMDGFDLCRAIRAGDRAHLPIIVVTSVGQSEEKKRALDAGADAYIVKSDFEQGYFLELVQHLALSQDL